MSTLVGVTNVSEPVYLALKKSRGEEIIESIYRGKRKSPRILRMWLRDQMHQAADEKKMVRGLNVPAIPALVFDAIVANETTPTIVLFGNPSTEYYNALKHFVAVKKSGTCGHVRFYRFNPRAQPTVGLPLRNGKMPRIAVYLAGKEVGMVDGECSPTEMISAIKKCLSHGLPK
jgi:hypothetical protein